MSDVADAPVPRSRRRLFAIWSPHEFFTMATVHSVASEQAITALVALAVLIRLAAGCTTCQLAPRSSSAPATLRNSRICATGF
jgi:hypothetical protein